MLSASLKKVRTKPEGLMLSALSSEDYQYICDLLKARSGLSLSSDKGYFIDSRLLPVARENSLKDMEELVAALKSGRPGLANQIVNAMMTHETFFFRDGKPFEAFEDSVLPFLKNQRSFEKKLNIWCAGCSSGQEPYSLAMILKENAKKFPSWKVTLLGTDISPTVIEKAKKGRYTQFEAQRGLPGPLLKKYFKETDCDWQINSHLRNAVKYQVRNLMDDFREMGPFDVIFCRNVLVHFDPTTKARVLEKMAEVLAPDGFLFLGASETVLGFSNLYTTLEGKRGIYSKASS